MGIFRLDRSYRVLGAVIGMHILLNISLFGVKGKLTALEFLLGLA